MNLFSFQGLLILLLLLLSPWSLPLSGQEVPPFIPFLPGITQVAQPPLLSKLEALKTKGTFQKDRNTYDVPMTVEGHSFILSYHPDDHHFTIDGIETDGQSSTCLYLKIKMEENSAHVSSIQTRDINCGLPRKGAGNLILKTVDRLAADLGLKKITLLDASEVQCEKNGEGVSLSFLHMMQKGETWYGSKGYHPNSIPHLKFQKIISKLRNLDTKNTLDLVQRILKKEALKEGEKRKALQKKIGEFDQVFPWKFETIPTGLFAWRKKLLQQGHAKDVVDMAVKQKRQIETLNNEIEFVLKSLAKIEKMEAFLSDLKQGGKTGTLSDFLEGVWKKDCTLFSGFMEVFFPDTLYSFYKGPFKDYYVKFIANASNLEKVVLPQSDQKEPGHFCGK